MKINKQLKQECWECKKKVKSARTVLYVALNSYDEPICEKERDVCD